ncbi:MAG: serine/threonine protein kinase [Planctomycetes bacterium]|nr:serine/threonine protein kinase [Planctomycetota bacterium]
MSPSAVPATVVDFLFECALDLQANRLQPLRHYLSRYPGHEEAIAREYLALVDDRERPAASTQRVGRFELLRELARGGQGRVYLARDPMIGRFMALKVLALTGSTDGARRERFRREIDAATRLDHPYICRLLEADVDHSPPYVSMELLPGHSLAELLAHGEGASTAGGGLIAPRGRTQLIAFARFFAQVAAAVHAVHCAGIVHRDLKPANLMVTPDGEPRVLDFGLASPAERIGEVTMTDTLIGTLPYMAPEQLTGGGRVDRRVDVFALGLTMLECALRERPFAGRSPEARLASIQAGLPMRLLRRLHPDLRAILVMALAEKPEGRYATCQELADDLHRLCERRPVRARRVGMLVIANRWCARHPWLTTWFSATAIAVGLTWQGVGVAREALAESRRLDVVIRDAVRSFDPWGPGGGVDAFTAIETLRGAFDARGDTRQRLAMLELRRGRITAVRALVDQPDVPHDERTAAMLFACRLLERSQDEDAPFPELPPVDSEALAREVAEIAGELYRHGCWQQFDALTAGALACFDTLDPLHDRCRLPLVLWQVQAACVRRKLDDAGLFDAEKQRLVARHGRDSEEVADAEERFLLVALQVVPGQFLLDLLRLRLRQAAALARDPDGERALRLRAISLVHGYYPRPDTVARLEAVRTLQIARLGADHPDTIRTSWMFGRWLSGFDDARSAELLAAAWTAEARLPAGHEELRANVRRDYAACRGLPLDANARAQLGAEVIREHLRLWGAGDPRTLEALAKVPLDPARTPEVWLWYEQALARIPADEPGREQRDAILSSLLARHAHTPRLLACEQHALAQQGGPAALSIEGARRARDALASLWLQTHAETRGERALIGIDDAVRQWRRYLGADDPGDGFRTEMLIALGGLHLEAGRLADADLVLQAAAHAAAREQGRDDPDWLMAAESLPTSEPRWRHLCETLARLSDGLGRDEASVRMWRRCLPERTLVQRLGGTYFPACYLLCDFAWVLVRRSDYTAAERELERALAIHAERKDVPADVAVTRRALLDLYIVSDQPAKAAAQRQLLGR